MSATVYYADSNQFVTVVLTFTVNNMLTDGSVVFTVTDPLAATSTPSVTHVSLGKYSITVATPTAGTWNYEAVATGASFDSPVQAGTFDVNDPALSKLYCTPAELKSRLGITDTGDDFEVLLACQAATRSVDEICGRYFWRGTDTRTYVPESIWRQSVDDLVSVTTLKVDQDGDGVYEQTWTSGTDYALEVAPGRYNTGSQGEQWPYTGFTVINSGKLLPFIYPWRHLDAIQIAGVFGWPAVPLAVKQAALIAAADLFKLKDAPFGVAGFGEFGVVRVGDNPRVQRLLRRYISGDRVGV